MARIVTVLALFLIGFPGISSAQEFEEAERNRGQALRACCPNR
jgi:hypothetical protein